MSYLFECIECGKHYLPGEALYLCPACSAGQKPMEPLRGLMRIVYDMEAIGRSFDPEAAAARNGSTFARYMEIFPISSADSVPPLFGGATPLRPVPNLRRVLKHDGVWLKDDTVSSTASFKDRASALVVAVARESGRDTVATASTGNAATALAGQAASVGLKTVIFVPRKAPPAKLAQIAVFGGMLVPVKGTYDEAFELSRAACDEFGWFNRNTALNPFTTEGKKSAALEIWEQMGRRSPDWVVVPTGDGVILAGVEKGFSDLAKMGFVDRVPRLAVIQAEGCRPIVDAWEAGRGEILPEKKPRTIADSISVGVPRAGRWVMQALARNGGACAAVSDEEILDAIALLGKTTGVFAEPAAAAGVAGLKKMIEAGTIKRDESVVALVTGSGLKDVAAAGRAVSIPKAIDPDLASLKKLLS